LDKDSKKKITIFIIVIALLLMIVHFVLPKSKKTEQELEQPVMTEESTQTQTGKSDDSGAQFPEEELEEEVTPTGPNGETQADINAMLLELGKQGSAFEFHENNPDVTTETVDIGQMQVTYRADDARYGSGNVFGRSLSGIWYNDGDENNTSGFVFAMNAFGSDQVRPESMDDAKYLISEYIPDGTGVISEWEENENYYVRKVTGYDDSMDGAYISYTIVPKGTDSNIYTATYTVRGDDYTPVSIKESSYNSMMEPMLQMVPDSEMLTTTYDEEMSRLTYVNYYETASDRGGMGGIREIKEAQNEYYLTTYGVALDGSTERKFSDLTEEEKKDARWKAEDPVGYAQKQMQMEREEKAKEEQEAYEKEQEAAEAAALAETEHAQSELNGD